MPFCLVWPGPEANPAPPYQSGGGTVTPTYYPNSGGWDCDEWRRHFIAYMEDWYEEWPPD